jgi:hypothetical protein
MSHLLTDPPNPINKVSSFCRPLTQCSFSTLLFGNLGLRILPRIPGALASGFVKQFA